MRSSSRSGTDSGAVCWPLQVHDAARSPHESCTDFQHKDPTWWCSNSCLPCIAGFLCCAVHCTALHCKHFSVQKTRASPYDIYTAEKATGKQDNSLLCCMHHLPWCLRAPAHLAGTPAGRRHAYRWQQRRTSGLLRVPPISCKQRTAPLLLRCA